MRRRSYRLRTIATEHAFYFPSWSLGPAFARAEHDGQFVVDEVSPVKAATHITVPVLAQIGDWLTPLFPK